MSALPLRAREGSPPLIVTDASGRRSKLWDITPALHCSIIGTCLSAAELRQFFVKLGDATAKTASDHALHSYGVNGAAKHDLIGKLLNKALDARREAAIRRFSKASSREQVRDLRLEAFEQGGIPGGYWALLTHPATDRPLVEEAFGQVHMLSHMVGFSDRTQLKLCRIIRLERMPDLMQVKSNWLSRAPGLTGSPQFLARVDPVRADVHPTPTVGPSGT
jgi:hypothetical protein